MVDMDSLDIGSVITAPSTSFVVKDVLGVGAFGEVALCRNTKSRNTVALKIIKDKEDVECAKDEKAILKMLKEHGSEEHNIVRWISSFEFSDTYCLEFERLDISLSEFIAKNNRMSLTQIRPVLHQVATAMKFVKSLGIIHGDLKPENIMMVDHASSLRVKVIDFGAAHPSTIVTRGDIIQTPCYRAPEVFLGTKYNEAIDAWSLGCIALEMLTGLVLFPGVDDDDIVRHIVKTVGTPPNLVLHQGEYTKRYFHRKKIRGKNVWRLKSRWNRLSFNERVMNSLEDLHHMDRKYFESLSIDRELDWQYFVDLVSRLLCLDPKERITPEEILEHPFISMRHIVEVFDTEHVSQSVEMMGCVSSRLREQQADNEQPSTSRSNRPSAKRCADRSSQKATGAKRRKKSALVKYSCSSSLSPLSGSRKRSREDEEDTERLRQSPKIMRPGARLIPMLILVRVDQVPSCNRQESVSGSRKRSREEEGEEEENKGDRPLMVMKRSRSTSRPD